MTNQGVRSLSDILHQALISFVHHYSLNCTSRYFHPVGSNIQGDKANARTKLNDLHILSDRVLTDFLLSPAAVDVTNVEDQILDNSANLHSSPIEDVAHKMEEIREETELERQKLMKAMKLKSAKKKVQKQ